MTKDMKICLISLIKLEVNGVNYLLLWVEDLHLKSLKQFERMLPKYINDVLDRGYDVFKNNPTILADNIRPTKTIN